MQHYGLPTRLLDWTESALLGLYFAVRENHRGTDAGVWVLNPWWLNHRSLGRREIPFAGDSALEPWAPLSKRGPLEGTWPVAMRPEQGTLRIAVQKGFFTIHGRQRGALNRLSNLHADNGPGLRLIRIPLTPSSTSGVSWRLRASRRPRRSRNWTGSAVKSGLRSSGPRVDHWSPGLGNEMRESGIRPGPERP